MPTAIAPAAVRARGATCATRRVLQREPHGAPDALGRAGGPTQASAPPFDLGKRGVIAPNLLDRQFEASGPNQKWAADFTYLWTGEGGLYIAVVLDLYSRRIVGWSMQPQVTAQLVTDALLMQSGGGAPRRRTCCITRTKAADTPAKPSSDC